MDEDLLISDEGLDGVDVVLALREALEPATEPHALARLGRYELLGRIAIGGMAEIFLARERAGGAFGSRNLVVKVMRPQLDGDAELQSMFLNEGRVALRLQHPNICHVYECGVEAGRCFIAMEHVRGVTLRELMRRSATVGQSLPVPIVVKIAAKIAEALHSAHCARDESGQPLRVVHRDVSPQNVMIGFDGVVKLLDFGVAQAQTGLSPERAGTIRGKFGYLAPEQCLGKPVDARTDVFALGVCIWEAIAGRRLYSRSGDVDALAAVVHEDAPDVREINPAVPAELAAILHRALARAPDDRFSSAAELQQALEQLLTDRRELVNGARIASVVSHLFGGEPPVELDRSPEAVGWIHEQEQVPAVRRSAWWVAIPAASAVLAFALLAWAQREPEPARTVSREPVAAASRAWSVPDVVTESQRTESQRTESQSQPTQSQRTESQPTEAREIEARAEDERRAMETREPPPPRHSPRRRRPLPGGFVEDPGF